MAHRFHSGMLRTNKEWWTRGWPIPFCRSLSQSVWCTVFNWRIHIPPAPLQIYGQIKVFTVKEACHSICIWMLAAVGKFEETLESLYTELEGWCKFLRSCQQSNVCRKWTDGDCGTWEELGMKVGAFNRPMAMFTYNVTFFAIKLALQVISAYLFCRVAVICKIFVIDLITWVEVMYKH